MSCEGGGAEVSTLALRFFLRVAKRPPTITVASISFAQWTLELMAFRCPSARGATCRIAPVVRALGDPEPR